MRRCFINISLLLFVGSVLWILGCADLSQSDPRQTVIAMFGAMEKNDEAALAHLLDLAELMKNVDQDYSLNTTEPRVITNPKQILEDLTHEGVTKKRWFAHQRIVNAAKIAGESATVEVTFVNKEESKGYRTFFGLHMQNGRWKIYSFKTLEEPPTSE